MIGMTSVTFRGLSAEEIIDICSKNSVSKIEWGGDVHVPCGDFENAEKIGGLTRSAGLEVASYGSYYRIGKDSADEFENVLLTAKALGAPLIRVWCGEKGSALTSTEEFENYAYQLREMCKAASHYNIKIACEFHNNTYNDTAETALRLINAVNSPLYGTYWQTLTYDETDFENLKKLLPYVLTVHVFAWNKRGRRYSLRHQREKWRQIFELCRDYNPNYIMEFVKRDSVKCFSKDVKTLKSLF